MNEYGVCPKCGNELKANAPQGMCPECLMREGLGTIGADTMLEDVEKASPSDTEIFDEAPGKYTLVGEHARGGMGRVLLVHDESLGRDVALKELLPPDGVDEDGTPIEAQHSKELVARFLREAKITGQLEHPSITPVHELGRREDGSLYYTMKLVRGKTLQKAIAESETLDERLKLLPHFVDLCNAVAYAHSRHVIHRDIKPANVMIGDYGETVIVDWGLAKVQDKSTEPESVDPSAVTVMGVKQATPGSGHKTQIGELLGTPVYMSPEQAKGLPADELSDVYSLGAVLYEILSGHPPFRGSSIDEIITKVIYDEPIPLRQVDKKISRELARICANALARERDERTAAAAVIAKQVERMGKIELFLNPLRPYMSDLVPELKGLLETVRLVVVGEATRRLQNDARHKGRPLWLAELRIIPLFVVWASFFFLVGGLTMVTSIYTLRTIEYNVLRDVAIEADIEVRDPWASRAPKGALPWPVVAFVTYIEMPSRLAKYMVLVQFSTGLLFVIMMSAILNRMTQDRRSKVAPYVREVIAEWEVLGKFAPSGGTALFPVRKWIFVVIGSGTIGGIIGWWLESSNDFVLNFLKGFIGAVVSSFAAYLVAQVVLRRAVARNRKNDEAD